jgi:hypothetical protein
MINPNWIFVGVALQTYGAVVYLVETVKGRIKPNRVTWILWSLSPLIAFYAMIKQGVGPEAWSTFIIGFMPILVFIATFVNKKSYWKLEKLDFACGFFSILGLVLWQVTKVGNLAIIFSIVADAFASVPTIIKAYKDPESENYVGYFLGIFNAVISLLVIRNWNFQNYAFQSYWLIVTTILVILIKFKIGKSIKHLDSNKEK